MRAMRAMHIVTLVGLGSLLVAAAIGCGAGVENGDGAGAHGAGATANTSASPTTTGTNTGNGGGFAPQALPCDDHAGQIICVDNTAITCDDAGVQEAAEDCGDNACLTGTGCVLCLDGQFSCDGNILQSCNTAAPIKWDVIDTCNPASEVCDAKQGACVPLVVTGGGTVTGQYYRYARFTADNSPFLGGYDTDSYGNLIYVNRGGQYLDVYTVDLLDTDGDGKLEPNQHPENPVAKGEVEERVLTLVKTYSVPDLGSPNSAELFAAADRVYWIVGYPAKIGAIYEYIFATGLTTKLIDAPSPLSGMAFLGRDELTGTWYSGVHYERVVYSFHATSGAWIPEFKYPDLAGDHMDGLEVVTDPNDGTTYVYVSDMTSDFIGQYVRVRGGGWLQQNLFAYDGTADMVEGMGFGAFNHFWVSGHPKQSLYELGGGELAKYVEPDEPPK